MTAAATSAAAAPAGATLFERIGGEAGVKALVAAYIEALL